MGARENIYVADQIKHLLQMEGIINPGDKIGPTPTSGPPSSSAILPPPPPGVPNVSALVAGVPPSGMQRPEPPQMVPVPPPPRPPIMEMPPRPPIGITPRPPMGMLPRPPMMAPPSMPPRMIRADESPNKTAMSEDNLMQESLWLAQHNSGPITDKVVIPQDSSKPEWNNNGQTFTLTLPLSDLEKTMEEELTCMICQELLIEATNLNCAHTFCSFCLQEWKKTREICPYCSEKINSESRCLAVDSYIDRVVVHLGNGISQGREAERTLREEQKPRPNNNNNNNKSRRTEQEEEEGEEEEEEEGGEEAEEEEE